MQLIHAAQRSEADLLREVAACVRNGGTVVFPTETVYGLGCDPDNEAAIDALFSAKGRSRHKALALHVSGVNQALPYISELSSHAREAMEIFWPGPVAIVVRRNPDRYERAACGLPTISLRCPSDDVCRALLAVAGPLAATSANRSGAKAFTGNEDELSALPEASMAVLAGPCALGLESTIVDCSGEQPMLIREGAVPAATIAAKFGTLRLAR